MRLLYDDGNPYTDVEEENSSKTHDASGRTEKKKSTAMQEKS